MCGHIWREKKTIGNKNILHTSGLSVTAHDKSECASLSCVGRNAPVLIPLSQRAGGVKKDGACAIFCPFGTEKKPNYLIRGLGAPSTR